MPDYDQNRPLGSPLPENPAEFAAREALEIARQMQGQSSAAAALPQLPAIPPIDTALGKSFHDFEYAAELGIDDEEVSDTKASLAQIVKSEEQLATQISALEQEAQKTTQLLAKNEAEVSRLYTALTAGEEQLAAYEERRDTTTRLVSSKQITLAAAENDLASTSELLAEIKLQISNRQQNLTENRLLLETKTQALNEACGSWQQRYNDLQQSKLEIQKLQQNRANLESKLQDLLTQQQQDRAAATEQIAQLATAACTPAAVSSTALPEKAAAAAEQPTQDFTEWEEPQPRKKRSAFWGYLLCIVIAALIALGIRTYVFQVTLVSGESMAKTIMPDDRVITSCISYLLNEPQRGDIVVFYAPDTTQKICYVKRVIGLAGDHVVITDGQVAVNGEILHEEYLQDGLTVGEINTIVPENAMFVLGDNRAVSHDSRAPEVSSIQLDQVVGKVTYRVLPIDSFGKLN